MRRTVAGVVGALVAGGLAGGFGAPAQAAPGNPGVPSDPVVLFEEDFENLADGEVVTLEDYVGAGGEDYAAEGAWDDPSQQNGFILDGTSTDAAQAAVGGSGNYAQLRNLVTGIGTLNGTSPATANHAAAAYTAGDPGDDPQASTVQFRTAAPLAIDVEDRFLSFSANVGAVNCHASHPQLQFLLDDAGTEIPVTAGAIDACGSLTTGSNFSTLVGNAPVLFSGSELGIVLRNLNTSGGGNDASFDDIRVLDVTPQLDKEFVDPAYPGAAVTMRFTVTNTSELAPKPGWSFTDDLPTGLEIAPEPAFTTTCTNGSVTAGGTAGDTSVSFEGDLTSGQASCTLEIDVLVPTTAPPGTTTYTNGPANLADVVGLNPPADATLTVEAPGPIFGTCDTQFRFDADAAGWRRATVQPATDTVISAPVTSPWNATEGNPGGALVTTDPDSNWTEWWTPHLLNNGYTTDYSGQIGSTLQFDYRNDTGLQYNLYFGVRNNAGETYWFNFVPQITDSQAWNRVRVPLEASAFRTGFNNTVGVDMASPAPTDAEFADVMTEVSRFVISAEGRSGADTTFLDNFGTACDDLGDAPASYTTAGGEAPAHTPIGYDEAASTADLTLGTSFDHEPAGQPSPAADGDDTTGTDDEDGVAGPVVVVPGTATVVPVEVTNDTADPATLVGWLDLDGNGTFDAGERSDVVAVPASSGTAAYDVTFPAGTLAADSFARFRLYSGTVAAPQPTGPVTGGEVEDVVAEAMAPELEIVKTGVLTTDGGTAGVADVGDVITYTFTVTNTGNVTVDDVSVTDPMPGLSAITPASVASIAPGDDEVFEATYTVTQADVDLGDVVNQATAEGTDPTGGDVTDTDEETVDAVAPDPSLDIVKSSELTTDGGRKGQADLGDVLTYTFRVTNDGNVTAFDVSVNDDLPGLSAIDPASVAELAPGATAEFTATYRIRRSDVRDGVVRNRATATFTPPTPRGDPPATPHESSPSNVVRVPVRAPGRPRIRTEVTRRTVELPVRPGGDTGSVALRDRVRISGFTPGGTSTGTARLYGPVDDVRRSTCRPANLVGERGFTVRNGRMVTQPLRVSEPGYYTWVVSTTRDAYNRAGRHRCGLRAETTLVTRPAYDSPDIETGPGADAPGIAGTGRIVVPNAGIDATVVAVGRRGGEMVIPSDISRTGWLVDSAASGEAVGTTVVAGHVSDRRDRPGAFWRLRALRRGAVVEIETPTGEMTRYRVTRTFTTPRGQLPQSLFRTGGEHRLALVSCSGRITYPNGNFHYTKNVVVIAEPVR